MPGNGYDGIGDTGKIHPLLHWSGRIGRVMALITISAWTRHYFLFLSFLISMITCKIFPTSQKRSKGKRPTEFQVDLRPPIACRLPPHVPSEPQGSNLPWPLPPTGSGLSPTDYRPEPGVRPIAAAPPARSRFKHVSVLINACFARPSLHYFPSRVESRMGPTADCSLGFPRLDTPDRPSFPIPPAPAFGGPCIAHLRRVK